LSFAVTTIRQRRNRHTAYDDGAKGPAILRRHVGYAVPRNAARPARPRRRSAVDPISTLSIERLLKRLADELTIIIVTHKLQQAARVGDETILLAADGAGGAGRVVEIAPTARLFTEPGEARTEAYPTGRL
jgi:hypothetical protein